MTKKDRTYLDYNATAPLRPEVVEAMYEILAEPGNPSSIHQEGRAARKIVEQARAHVAELVGCHAKQVIFTSGATESNNTLLKGYASHRRILISATEHSSIISAGVQAELIPTHRNGLIDTHALKSMLEAHPDTPTFVAIMMVNNETGVIQPIKEIAQILSDYDCIFHTDAAQAAGRIPVYFPITGAHFMSLSAHKFGGPQGVGALIMANGTNPPPFLTGGGQERRQRAGTENVAGIHGMGVAAKIALEKLDDFEKLRDFQSQIESHLLSVTPSASINGASTARVANTTSVCIEGFDASTLLMSLDLEGIAVSTGSACSSGSIQASHVLLAMGASNSLAKSGLRISSGWATTQEDIDAFKDAWTTIMKRLN